MKKQFRLTITLFLLLNFSFGQNSDTTTIKLRGCYGTNYYIDGFKVYSNLTKKQENKILENFVSELNGCWKLDSTSSIQHFNLSNKSFSGTWYTKGIQSTAPLVRLEILNGQIKLINTDLIGGDSSPINIRIFNDTLFLEYADYTGIGIYKRQDKCPDKR